MNAGTCKIKDMLDSKIGNIKYKDCDSMTCIISMIHNIVN